MDDATHDDASDDKSSTDTWVDDQRIYRLFSEWNALRAGGQNVSLEELCRDAPELIEPLRSCIAAMTDGEVVSRPRGEVPSQVGSYKVLRQIARGGSSSIYEAESSFPRRRVALKLLDASSSSPRIRSRFELEVRLLSALQHPGIVKVFDAGRVEMNGEERAFFTMEWIDGHGVGDYVRAQCKKGDWSTKKTVELLMGFCDALCYAHQSGVIHRDLKPANMLVDSEGRPRLIDFGIARVQPHSDMTIVAGLTSRTLVGTRPYMSPEQFDEDPSAVDARSDIYGLGVVFYELLTGKLPYDVRKRSFVQVAEVIRETPPVLPSTFDRSLRGDLETIVLTMLAKEPSERYATMQDLIADLRRYSQGFPVHAKRPTALVTFRRWCSRHPRAARLSAAAVLSLVSLSIIALWMASSAARRSDLLTTSNINLKIAKQRVEHQLEKIQRNESELRRSTLALQDSSDRMLRSNANSTLLRLSTLAERLPQEVQRKLDDEETFPASVRGFGWSLLNRMTRPDYRRFAADGGELTHVGLSADGKRVVSGGLAGIRVWDSGSLECLVHKKIVLAGNSQALDVSPTGDVVWFVSGNQKVSRLDVDQATVQDLPTGTQHKCTVICGVPGTDRYLVGDAQGSLALLAASEDQPLLWVHDVSDQPIISIALNEAGDNVGVVASDGKVEVLSLVSGQPVHRAQVGLDAAVHASWDAGLHWVSVSERTANTVLWDVRRDKLMKRWNYLGVSPQLLMSSASVSLSELKLILSGRGRVSRWAGRERESVLYDAWQFNVSVPSLESLNGDAPEASNGVDDEPRMIAVADDVPLLACALRGGDILLMPTETQAAARLLQTPYAAISGVCFSPDGKKLAVSGGGGNIDLYDFDTQTMRTVFEQSRGSVFRLRFDSQGRSLFALVPKNGLLEFPLQADNVSKQQSVDPKQRDFFLADQDIVGTCNAFQILEWDDAQRVTVGLARDAMVAVGTVDDGDCVTSARLPCPVGTRCLAILPGKNQFVTGGGNGAIDVWQTVPLKHLKRLGSAEGRIGGLAASPDGLVVASGHFGGSLLLWDTTIWQPQLILDTGLEAVRSAAFSPAGDRLAIAGGSGQIRMYETQHEASKD
ncbi:Serine/threonine-protein kinase PknB [Roseimaritima multifibrata]|uniref:Serine/threonine-protein kinase PknB n=1 Tax=Roseimaritima multifibrata TaxID=1930274 RepID=A0A517MNZ8_9BACT|nr:serine/threonine-protein kinase [Roseimaritima multifibrata]QDS96606.1 Serine/threonine-protein kinase PknB [Roseimaritima multifibrata]